ncbi:CHAD domain-containing protein [Pseudoroseicyclus aestuarii]|uniref:CHAD domain-containing protein n=1 Tax=Pseudoroseicyclus aestuarii TaxID=1795041 RepID=A0A318SWR7_9RHOB|nr:CHAD domain-containing protein [Pseudoroseicyclus aestuarii]PYE84826.1 CHAD domain-containing protein [Pseudoroseicyclus aestuarii]
MSYRFAPTDPSLAEGARRIAREELSAAVAGLEAPTDPHAAVHEARKAVKKTRGLLRLIRGGFSDYKAQNDHLREAGRLLSSQRDRAVLLETFERVSAAHADRLDRRRLTPLRRQLTEDREAADGTADIEERIDRFRGALQDIHDSAAHWHIKPKGWSAIEPGLARSYERAQTAMRQAERSRDAEALHDWRKRVKDHWYHTRLLSLLWPEGMKSHRKAARTLADLLGQHHDLDAFEPRLRQAELADGPKQALMQAVWDERALIEERAFALGPRLLAESPEALAARWKRLWKLRDRSAETA